MEQMQLINPGCEKCELVKALRGCFGETGETLVSMSLKPDGHPRVESSRGQKLLLVFKEIFPCEECLGNNPIGGGRVDFELWDTWEEREGVEWDVYEVRTGWCNR